MLTPPLVASRVESPFRQSDLIATSHFLVTQPNMEERLATTLRAEHTPNRTTGKQVDWQMFTQ